MLEASFCPDGRLRQTFNNGTQMPTGYWNSYKLPCPPQGDDKGKDKGSQTDSKPILKPTAKQTPTPASGSVDIHPRFTGSHQVMEIGKPRAIRGVGLI